MRRILLATVASMALAIPATAQQQQTGTPEQEQPLRSPADQSIGQPGQPMGGAIQQPAAQAQPQASQPPTAAEQQASQAAPSGLNEDDIRRVQQALNDRGVSAGEPDGIWGPETHAAVREFQNQENIDASGELNDETLTALGVQVSSMSEPTTTGSGASTTGSGSAQPETTGSGQIDSDPAAVSPGADEDASQPDDSSLSR